MEDQARKECLFCRIADKDIPSQLLWEDDDIVAFKDEQIIFVEIKSRTSTKYGLPSEAVTKEKIKHLLRTAETYLIIKNLMDIDVRIDVIEVYKEKGIYQINHLEQVI